MYQTAITHSGIKQKAIVFAAMMAIAVGAPYIGNQFITGPIVNATLIAAVIMLGTREALMLAIFPSLIGLGTGLLPAVLAPQIPFIIGGNALLIGVVSLLKNRSYWLGVIGGAMVKAAFLFGTTSIVTGLLMNEALVSKVAYMMSWPQLVTALAGGVLAFGVLKIARASR